MQDVGVCAVTPCDRSFALRVPLGNLCVSPRKPMLYGRPVSMTTTGNGDSGAPTSGASSIDEYLNFRRSLLPLEKMQIGDEQAAAYRGAAPFPHAVIDNFFDPVILDRVLSEFPGAQAI